MNTVSSSQPVSWTDQAIYQRIVDAVLDHRLPPGTRLTEDKLCSIFGVSRTRIKPILVRLGNEKIITLAHHRGASVTKPTPQESAEVFETRRLVEPVLLQRFMGLATAEDIAYLSRNIAQDREAQAQGNSHRAIGLTGEFHLYIARHAQHDTLNRLLHELVTRTCLILMAWGARDKAVQREHAACGCQEHRRLLDAIRLRDVTEAQSQMVAHLHTIESQLHFSDHDEPEIELDQLLMD